MRVFGLLVLVLASPTPSPGVLAPRSVAPAPGAMRVKRSGTGTAIRIQR
ncbi:MAG: hypothetical protein AAF170_09970 [Bacteroidota bacterium]